MVRCRQKKCTPQQPELSHALSATFSFVVVLRVKIDSSEGFQDALLLPMLNVLFERSRHRLLTWSYVDQDIVLLQ